MYFSLIHCCFPIHFGSINCFGKLDQLHAVLTPVLTAWWRLKLPKLFALGTVFVVSCPIQHFSHTTCFWIYVFIISWESPLCARQYSLKHRAPGRVEIPFPCLFCLSHFCVFLFFNKKCHCSRSTEHTCKAPFNCFTHCCMSPPDPKLIICSSDSQKAGDDWYTQSH